RDLCQRVQGAVRAEQRRIPSEDARQVARPLVPGPALEHAELAGMVETDVERAVAAFRQPGEHPSRAATNGAVSRVNGPDEIARDEGLPPFVRPDAVRPLLVRERPGRAERHHEDERSNPARVDEDVLDDAETNRLQKRTGPSREPV